MPPLPMALSPSDGRRRFLCGRDVGLPGGRAGVPEGCLDGDGDPIANLAEERLFLVHDAGVERLLLTATPSDGSAQERWDTQVPEKRGFYGPTAVPGVADLLARGLRFPPKDGRGDVAEIATLRESGGDGDSEVVASAASSCFDGATVEIRKRGSYGWRTLGLRSGKKSIYHGIYRRGFPRLLYAEHLRTTAALVFGILNGTDSPRVLHLGLGAGVLPRFLADVLPESYHECVEIDRAVADLCPGASNVDVRVADALAFEASEPFDCVIVDIFDGANACPAAFYGDAFLEKARRGLLNERGFLIHNLHVGGRVRDAALADAAAGLDRAFGAAFRADSVGTSAFSGNALLLASKRPVPRARLHEDAAAAAARLGLPFDAATRVRRLRRVGVDGRS